MVDIRDIASLPEGKTVEFKRDLSSIKPILKTLIAELKRSISNTSFDQLPCPGIDVSGLDFVKY